MKKTLVLFTAISIVSSISQGQGQTQTQQAPAPLPSPQSKASSRALPAISGYCLPVSAGFLESEAKASDEMKKMLSR
jgi:hypothetical protein